MTTPHVEQTDSLVSAQYHVIARDGGFHKIYDQPVQVAAFLWGRGISQFMLIKTDAQGDRVVNTTAACHDVSKIQTMLDEA